MHGMSLVEIMVATAVGLIGVTMIMQVFAVAEGQKRTTTGSSDAQVSGNIALFNIERDLRYSGFGMVTNNGNMLGCPTFAFDRLRPGVQTFNFTMAPAIITVNADGNSDSIQVVYGNPAVVIEGALFSTGAGAGADFPLKNAAGFRVGDVAVTFEATKNCVMSEVTGFVPAAVNTVQHANAATYTYTDSTGNPVNVTERYNPVGGLPSGTPETYTASARLYAMGRNPVVKTYRVLGDRLVTQTLIPYVAAQDPDNNGLSDAEVATGIIQMKAMYGKDTNNDRSVDAWDTTLPTNAAEWMQVRAIKIALLARSGLFERTAVTPNAPVWVHPGTGAAVAFTMANLADGTNWQNYRYRVYQTTVPLRNLIWSNDP
jgi:type IV pilus assembly protein PilW